MEYINATTKTDQQMEALLKADNGGPVCMVNLLKFREKAEQKMGVKPTSQAQKPTRSMVP